jgi:dsRNA-specific ribonuclease
MVMVPSLPQDVAQNFITKLVLKSFDFDDGGREIPELDHSVLGVLDRLSEDMKRQIFNTKSFDPKCNYEDLEFIGDPALSYTISCLIEERHRDLNRGWRNVSARADGSLGISTGT